MSSLGYAAETLPWELYKADVQDQPQPVLDVLNKFTGPIGKLLGEDTTITHGLTSRATGGNILAGLGGAALGVYESLMGKPAIAPQPAVQKGVSDALYTVPGAKGRLTNPTPAPAPAPPVPGGGGGGGGLSSIPSGPFNFGFHDSADVLGHGPADAPPPIATTPTLGNGAGILPSTGLNFNTLVPGSPTPAPSSPIDFGPGADTLAPPGPDVGAIAQGQEEDAWNRMLAGAGSGWGAGGSAGASLYDNGSGATSDLEYLLSMYGNFS